jgi:hypothetical protein
VIEPANEVSEMMTIRETAMHVDCRTCPVREVHCSECIVPVLLELTTRAGRPSVLDPDERAAVSALLAAGLVGPETAERARAMALPDAPTAAVAAG